MTALVTVMNELQAIRSQFLVPTDSQDQYETPLTDSIDSMKSLGQNHLALQL